MEEREWAICLRILSLGAGRDSSAIDTADTSVRDAVERLNAMCKSEGNEDLVTRVYPAMTKLFQRCCSSSTQRPSTALVALAILQFFLDHGETVLHDADPSLRAFFRSCLVKQYADPAVAAATVAFLNHNKMKLLLSYSSVLPQFFPLLLKVIAWRDETLDTPFLQLFPALMGPPSFLQLFLALLDLPTLVLALESLEQRTGSLHGNMGNIRKNPAPEALLALMDEAYTGTFIDGGDDSSKEGSGRNSHYEADDLFSDLLKDENEGLAERHWSYPGMKATLEAAMGSVQSNKLKHALKFSPQLLQVYFDIALRDVSDSLLCALLPMVFFRIDAMFPDKAFSIEVQQTCFQFIHACFKKSPQFIALLKKPITDSVSQPQTSDGKTELALQLCWAIGEHGGGGTHFKDAARELFETLELVLYENLSSRRKTSAVPAQSRLLCFVITAIAKLATCHRELSPRARVCLAKVARSHQLLDKIVWRRARDYLGLMHDHAICSSILGGQHRPGTVEWSKAQTLAVANIPFYLLDEREGLPFHDFSFSDIIGQSVAS
ncbi:hypothetical protein SELMODRAFT_108875 [Selaginella moellendorffii]|uniref:AP-5 complex subunit zeta-1 n=1 Tax=Selaginella moellendorffii TaxID=88036 RepID=D8S564_SELML|nr:AP-5 complex subunit zeta-1 isoform X1 [Selaginella moellendorffii]EFJ20551.1 hypothetical protein SELMODRAFT_108875 [Selaginella moellendorffii]|eukprot:XP_002978565.1 AP-5 complex subunit zeta-1 isoform X1 [Selaginella moellendorffii]